MPCVARTTDRPAVGPANHASDFSSWLPPLGGRAPVIAEAPAEISRNSRRLRGWLIFGPSRLFLRDLDYTDAPRCLCYTRGRRCSDCSLRLLPSCHRGLCPPMQPSL